MKEALVATCLRMVRWACVPVVALGIGLVPAAPAQAGFCDIGQTCVIPLENTNVLGVDITILVTINNTGANTVLTVALDDDNLSNTPVGIDQFGYNSTALVTTFPASGGWSQANNCPCQIDGFGLFTNEIDDPGGTDLSFTFTLNSLVTTFTENATGAEFAAHIRYDNNCSAFVSDGTAATPGPPNGCVILPPRPAPEPATLLLLGAGLVGIAIARRRRV